MIRQPAKTTAVRRVAIIAADCRRILDEQAALIAALVARRHKVVCFSSAPSRAQVNAIETLGAAIVDAPISEAGTGFLRGLSARRQVALRVLAAEPHVAVLLDLDAVTASSSGLRRSPTTRVVAVLPGLPAKDGVIDRALAKAAPKISSLVLPREFELRRARAELDLPGDCQLRPSRGSGIDVIVRPMAMPPLSGPPSLLAWIESRDTAIAHELQVAVRSLPDGTLRLALAGPGARAGSSDAGPVDLHPPHVELREAFRSAHAVAVPTRHPSIPFSLRAALAAGRAVMTTNVAGASDAVDEGVNGVLADDWRAPALARAMAALVARPELLASMGRASRAKAERLYDEAAIVPELFEAMGLPDATAGRTEVMRRQA